MAEPNIAALTTMTGKVNVTSLTTTSQHQSLTMRI